MVLLALLLGVNVAIQFESIIQTKGLFNGQLVYAEIQGIDIDSSVVSLALSILAFIISVVPKGEKGKKEKT